MLCTPCLSSPRPLAPIVPRWSRPSGCKNAHRGLAGSCRAASRPTRSQAQSASGKKVRCVRTGRRTPLLPQGNQQNSLAPCQTFAEDVTARKAIADEEAGAEAAIAAAASLNDFLGATADVSNSLGESLGRSMNGVEAVSKGAMVLGAPFTFNDAVAAYHTRDPQKAFDASHGAASLVGGLINPMFGVGMATQADSANADRVRAGNCCSRTDMQACAAMKSCT